MPYDELEELGCPVCEGPVEFQKIPTFSAANPVVRGSRQVAAPSGDFRGGRILADCTVGG